MSEEKFGQESLEDGSIIRYKIWSDSQSGYISYYLPLEVFSDKSEQQLIGLVHNLNSFQSIPAEYTRQAGMDEIEDENGNLAIELTFALGKS